MILSTVGSARVTHAARQLKENAKQNNTTPVFQEWMLFYHVKATLFFLLLPDSFKAKQLNYA